MNEWRATVAIVRRHVDRTYGTDLAIACGLVGVLAYIFAPSLGRYAPFAICVLASASAGEAHTARKLRSLTFFVVPLFGRTLARAHAIAPSAASLALPIAYTVGATARGASPTAASVVVMACASGVATLIALSGAFRTGRSTFLYIGLGALVGCAICGVALWTGKSLSIVIALAAICGFFALRALGETYARYDPLPDRS